jgi:hypothetical protein
MAKFGSHETISIKLTEIFIAVINLVTMYLFHFDTLHYIISLEGHFEITISLNIHAIITLELSENTGTNILRY